MGTSYMSVVVASWVTAIQSHPVSAITSIIPRPVLSDVYIYRLNVIWLVGLVYPWVSCTLYTIMVFIMSGRPFTTAGGYDIVPVTL